MFNLDKLFKKTTLPERASSFRVVNIEARTIGQAVDQGRVRNGADRTDLNWVLTNSKKARSILRGNHLFFFPRVSDFQFASCVEWRNGTFNLHWIDRGCRWPSNARIVESV